MHFTITFRIPSLKYIEYGVYGDLNMVVGNPSSICLRGTVRLRALNPKDLIDFHRAWGGLVPWGMLTFTKLRVGGGGWGVGFGGWGTDYRGHFRRVVDFPSFCTREPIQE